MKKGRQKNKKQNQGEPEQGYGRAVKLKKPNRRALSPKYAEAEWRKREKVE